MVGSLRYRLRLRPLLRERAAFLPMRERPALVLPALAMRAADFLLVPLRRRASYTLRRPGVIVFSLSPGIFFTSKAVHTHLRTLNDMDARVVIGARKMRAIAALANMLPKRNHTLSDWYSAVDWICKQREPFLLADAPCNYQHTAIICRELHKIGLLNMSNRFGRVCIYWWP